MVPITAPESKAEAIQVALGFFQGKKKFFFSGIGSHAAQAVPQLPRMILNSETAFLYLSNAGITSVHHS